MPVGPAMHAGLVLALLVGAAGAQDDDVHPTRTLDPHRLRTYFFELHGRPPLLSERERWAGESVDELLHFALGSEAFWQNWLDEQLYYFLLVDNFRPHSERVLGAPARLASGQVGVREVLHWIALSASFDRRNPGPDTFVTVVMEQLLGMTVQKRPRDLEIGKRVYDGAQGNFLGTRGSSQADVVRIAIDSRDALAHLLTREHERIMRKPPEKAALARWVRRLDQDERAYAAILGEWFRSEDYEARLRTAAPLSNRAYVQALHVDLTNALPEPEEARRLREALDGLADAGPLRSVLAKLLIDSGRALVPRREEIDDPTGWIEGLFERCLGRPASQPELEVFAAAFADEACRPETVVYAIVSHPEYQSW